MCVLFIANQVVDDYPLIILANRDEFHQRPTKPLAYWPDEPAILAGRDLEARGTWLGVNKQGRVAALTNYRQGHNQRQDAPSRGDLVSGFLRSDEPAGHYLDRLHPTADQYNGFNLLVGTPEELYVYNNALDSCERLAPGFHGLSNASLNDPWPKINRGVTQLKEYLQQSISLDPQELLMLMQNDQQADAHLLPDTGVGLAREKFLSPIFIRGQEYGTRCSSLLMFDRDNRLHFTEFSYNPDGQVIAEYDYWLELAD